jgi:hypothetical protein
VTPTNSGQTAVRYPGQPSWAFEEMLGDVKGCSRLRYGYEAVESPDDRGDIVWEASHIEVSRAYGEVVVAASGFAASGPLFGPLRA